MFLDSINPGQEQITKRYASSGPIFAKAWWKALSKEKDVRAKVEWKGSGDISASSLMCIPTTAF